MNMNIDINTQFYKYLYNDLSLLNDEQLRSHYINHGKDENRICSERDFFQKYSYFDIEIYRKSNPDLVSFNRLELIKHYIYHGRFENRICSISKSPKKKVAIIFYGLSRSLTHTIKSIKENIFNVLESNNFDYDIYIHTYKIYGKYKNIWSGEETDNFVNEDVESILKPKYYLFDEQKNIENSIDFNEYYTFLRWNGYFPENTVRYIIKNLVLALYSKNKIIQLFNNNNNSRENQYDYAIISRPDMEFTRPIDVAYFNQLNENNIIIPEQDSYEGCNDRFCIGKPSIISYYGTLYQKLLEYSKKKNIISEMYLLDMLNLRNIEIIKRNITYNMIRYK